MAWWRRTATQPSNLSGPDASYLATINNAAPPGLYAPPEQETDDDNFDVPVPTTPKRRGRRAATPFAPPPTNVDEDEEEDEELTPAEKRRQRRLSSAATTAAARRRSSAAMSALTAATLGSLASTQNFEEADEDEDEAEVEAAAEAAAEEEAQAQEAQAQAQAEFLAGIRSKNPAFPFSSQQQYQQQQQKQQQIRRRKSFFATDLVGQQQPPQQRVEIDETAEATHLRDLLRRAIARLPADQGQPEPWAAEADRNARSAAGQAHAVGRPRTVFDVLASTSSSRGPAGKDLLIKSLKQQMPPSSYDLILNGAPYTVIGLQNHPPSGYLQAKRAAALASGNDMPLIVSADCMGLAASVAADLAQNSWGGLGGSSGGLAISRRANDALFLMIAYRMVRLEGLGLRQLLCLLEVAHQLRLEAHCGFLRAAADSVRTPEELFLLINAAATYMADFLKEGMGPRRLVAELQPAIARVFASGPDSSGALTRLVILLLLTWPPAVDSSFFSSPAGNLTVVTASVDPSVSDIVSTNTLAEKKGAIKRRGGRKGRGKKVVDTTTATVEIIGQQPVSMTETGRMAGTMAAAMAGGLNAMEAAMTIYDLEGGDGSISFGDSTNKGENHHEKLEGLLPPVKVVAMDSATPTWKELLVGAAGAALAARRVLLQPYTVESLLVALADETRRAIDQVLALRPDFRPLSPDDALAAFLTLPGTQTSLSGEAELKRLGGRVARMYTVLCDQTRAVIRPEVQRRLLCWFKAKLTPSDMAVQSCDGTVLARWSSFEYDARTGRFVRLKDPAQFCDASTAVASFGNGTVDNSFFDPNEPYYPELPDKWTYVDAEDLRQAFSDWDQISIRLSTEDLKRARGESSIASSAAINATCSDPSLLAALGWPFPGVDSTDPLNNCLPLLNLSTIVESVISDPATALRFMVSC